ncbi:MAG: hypothetical protein A2Y61_00230 [Chloroflexi bacterium RBG_13_60_13]|nr:MAG: hypothetical protein A2Y61_00230 [Chloroflexi bacterium RBG_13_60_13]
MGKNVQTNLQIALSTKGFDKGLRDILGVTQKSLDGLKKQSVAFGKAQMDLAGMRKKIQDLAKVQLEAAKAMEQIGDKAGAAYKYQQAQLDKAKTATKLLRQETSLLAASHRTDAEATEKLARAIQKLSAEQQRAQQAAKWAFTQGLAQGTGVGGMASMFLQRGPGFGRQIAGQMVGGALHRGGRFGAGLASTPFAGIQGLQTALSALPGGGLLAGQLGAVASHTGQALQFQRQRVEAAPFIGGSDPAAVAGAQAHLKALGTRPTLPRGKGAFDIPPSQRIRQNPLGLAGVLAEELALGIVGAVGMSREEASEYGRKRAGLPKSEAAKRQQVYDAERARRAGGVARARLGPALGLGEMGRDVAGIGQAEAVQRAAALYQTAGGVYTGGAAQQREFTTALAAQTQFGVGPGGAGAFLQAGRRGGLVGGRGQGAEALTSALSDAVEMGLEGSEITNYMQRVAQGIQQFQQTGIPFNKDSLKSLTMELAKGGIGGVRGAAMAGGLQQYVQGIGARGPTSGMDLMLMQAFGGFKGGGAGDYHDAIVQMEAMKGMGTGDITSGSKFGKLIQTLFAQGGGGKGAAVTLRGMLGGIGMKGSQAEISAMIERVTGAQILTPEQRALAMSTTGAEGKVSKLQTPEQLMQAASTTISSMGPNLKKQADIINQQLGVGQSALTAVQNLETATVTINSAFMSIAGGPLTDFSKTISDLTLKIKALIDSENIMDAVKRLMLGT